MQIYRCRAGCHGILLQWKLKAQSVHQIEPDFIVTLIPTIQHNNTDYRYEGRRAIFTMREWLLCYAEICREEQLPKPNPYRCWEPRIKRAAGDSLKDVEIHIITLAAEHAV